jgi:hypothetical protein
LQFDPNRKNTILVKSLKYRKRWKGIEQGQKSKVHFDYLVDIEKPEKLFVRKNRR